MGPLDYLTALVDSFVDHQKFPGNLKEVIRSAEVITALEYDTESYKSLIDLIVQGNFAEFMHLLNQVKSRGLIATAQESDRRLTKWHEAWNHNFEGDALQTFLLVLKEHESSFDKDSFYSKLLPIVQSSGMGKSRLMDQFSKLCPAVLFTLRKAGQSGYPPGDTEVTTYLLELQEQPRHRQYAGIISFLSASFQKLTSCLADLSNELDILDRSLLAAELHAKMSPSQMDLVGSPASTARYTRSRSDFRIQFCAQVVSEAKEKVHEFLNDGNWQFFCETSLNLEGSALVEKHLLEPLRLLLAKTIPSPASISPIPFFIMFDEISNLLGDRNRGLYTALRRILRLLCEFPVWTFVLSTQSPLNHISPAIRHESSARVVSGELERISPYYSFPLDIGATAALSRNALAEKTKPLERFSEAAHMSMFGRPLWMAYKNDSCDTVRSFVRAKLLCSSTYDPTNPQHVFAALASRICLDPCMIMKDAVEFAEGAVNAHLRVVVQMDNNAGLIKTITPFEPLVAEAVAKLLSSHPDLWKNSLYCLHAQLLQPGLIEKGRAGELGARLLLIIAHDQAINTHPIQSFRYARPLKLTDFFKALFGKDIAHHMFKEPVVHRMRTRKSKRTDEDQTIASVFDCAYINFTHFASTEAPLHGSLTELLHNLMYGQAALQLCANQPTWDLLIPIYFGACTAPFDTKELSALFIQVKNRQKPTPLLLNAKDFLPHFPADSQRPVLSILLDLGIAKAKVAVSPPITNRNVPVYGFSVAGFGTDTYGCLSEAGFEELKHVCNPHILSMALQNSMGQRNMRYRYHTWDDRFPMARKSQEDAKRKLPAEKDDGPHSVASSSSQRAQERKRKRR